LKILRLPLPRGAPQGGGACRTAADFVDMISNALHDFRFSQNQPLKSADDQYIKILKNELIKYEKQEDGTA
jgi:hypothetical protein